MGANQRLFAPFFDLPRGYFQARTVSFTSTAYWSTWLWLQVRVWGVRVAPTYELAVARGIGGYGESALFYAQGTPGPLCGGAPCLPGSLIGLQSFRLRTGSAVLIRSITRQADQIVIESYGGFAGYQLQHTPDLSQAWQQVGDRSSDSKWTNSISGPRGFFRVIGFVE